MSVSYYLYLNEIFEFAPQCRKQEIVQQGLNTTFAKLQRDRKPYHTFASLCGVINPNPTKTPII